MGVSYTAAVSSAALAVIFLCPNPLIASDTTVVAEARYLMADGDTLAQAEETVLQRAKRRAVEKAGMYLESTFLDVEKTDADRTVQVSSLEIRTIAAAVTRTEVLESHRSFEQDRPSFYVRIRAVVDLDHLEEAIRRQQSERQFAEHFRRLQKENSTLKAQIREMNTASPGVHTVTISAPRRDDNAERAHKLVEQAILTPNFQEKLSLTSQAAVLAPQSADPLVVRGQTYLQLVSTAYSKKSKPSEYSKHIDNARMDFDRALMIDPRNTWALLGQGDVNTWRRRMDEAARSYEHALALDPFFDVARHRLIRLYTTEARKLTTANRWTAALSVLQKLLADRPPDGWISDYKEAYLLRSDIYQKLNQPSYAIEDLSVILRVNPTDTGALLARAKLYRDQLQGRMAKDDLDHACLLGSAEACRQLP